MTRMKESTTALLALSEIREKVNTFAEDGASEDLDRLKKESIEFEGKYRAAVTAEENGEERRSQGSEHREYLGLLSGASLGKMISAVASGRQVDGAESELLRHHNLPGNAIPLAMLAAEPEKFAIATLTGDEPASTGEVLGTVFPQSVAQWCGVVGSTVPTGQRQVPVLTAGADASALAKAAPVTESAATFAITTLVPRRISASVRYAREDALTFGYLDDALRANLRNAIADEIDKVLLTRATNPKGLLAFGTAPTKNDASTTNISHALAGIFAGVDGKYASMASEVKLLLGPSTYSDLGVSIFDPGSGLLGQEKLSAICGGLRVSANVPTKDASTGEDAVIVKGMGRRNCVSALWDSIEIMILADPFTNAAKGEVILTASAFFDFAILDEGGFARLRFK